MQGISRTASSAAISAGLGDMLAQRILNASGLEDEEFDYDQQYDESQEFNQHEAAPQLESVEEPVLVRPLGSNGHYVRQGNSVE